MQQLPLGFRCPDIGARSRRTIAQPLEVEPASTVEPIPPNGKTEMAGTLMVTFKADETLDRRFQELLTQFEREWTRYWGLSGSPPQDVSLVEEQEVRRLVNTAYQFVRAAESLSSARLPDRKRTLPDVLQMEAVNEESRKPEVLEVFEAQSADQPWATPEFWSKLAKRLERTAGPARRREVFFRSAVELHAFKAFGTTPGPIASRTLQLLSFLVAAQNDRVRAYLARVSRCFILDLEPELTIMARAVLEAALGAAGIDDAIERVREVKKARWAGLSIMIEAASLAELLDEEGRIAAEAVSEAGNYAVHNAPGTGPKAEEILAKLKLVLEQLEK